MSPLRKIADPAVAALPMRMRNGVAAIACTVLLAAATAAGAQHIYMWTDEDGVQHFSDREPGGDYEVAVQRAVAEPSTPVRMTNVGTERKPEWEFSNRMHGPVTVAVRLDDAQNIVSEPELPSLLEVPGQGRRSVWLGPLEPGLGWRYRIGMNAVAGSVNARPDPDFHYRLPLPDNVAPRIGQGFNGSFSHRETHSRYAIDFTLEVGTPVHAARGGRVMDIERYFHRNGRDLDRDGPRANYVRILHDDGSMAVYAHLDYNAITVRPGERVEAGRVIGRSGNTGYSTGPHLHFAIQVNRGMELTSIPFRMLDHDGTLADWASR